MAVKLDIEINFDSKRVLAFDRGLAGLELASKSFETAFVRASKAVNSEAAKMNNSLLELLATTTMLGQEMAKIKFQPGNVPSLRGGGSSVGGRASRSRVRDEAQEAAESLENQKRYYRRRNADAAKAAMDAKQRAADERAALAKKNADEEKAAAESLAAQKEYYRRRNLAERQRAADAKRNANDIARAERAALIASGQDRGGVGLTQMALAESGGSPAGGAGRGARGGGKGGGNAFSQTPAGRLAASKGGGGGSLLEMAGSMSQGGALFKTAKFAADINALPFGYERYGVRMAKTAELGIEVFKRFGPQIAKATGLIGLAVGAVTTFSGGLTHLAKSGNRDAQSLANALSRLPGPIESVYTLVRKTGEAFTGLEKASSRMVGTLMEKIPGLMPLLGALGDGIAAANPDNFGQRGQDRVSAGRDMANQSATERARARADRKREREIGGLTDKGNIEEQIRNARQQEVFANTELAGMKKPKSDKDASPEYRAAEERKRAIEAEIVRLEARRDEIDSEAAEKALEASRKRADILIETRKSLVAVRAEMAGTVFDPDAVVGLDAVNASLEQQVAELTTLSEEFRLTEEDRAERLAKINDLLARQKQEQRFLVEMEQARSEFAAKMADSSLAAKGEAVDRTFNPAREQEAFAKSQIDMLQQRGLISERQANEGRRALAQSDLESKALEEQFKIDRERLELARQKAEQDKASAKTAQDEQKARQELLKAEQGLAEQGLTESRKRAEMEERRAAAMRQQAQLEAQQRIERQAAIAEQVQNQQTGAIQQQMQQQQPNQGRIQQQMFGKRLGTALQEREQKEGRKLNRREQMEVYNEQRKQFQRDVNGPTSREQEIEAGRQRGAERRALRQQNQQNRGLPAGLAAANNRLAAQGAQDSEASRQQSMQSGAFGQAMNSGTAAEAAQAQGAIAQQQVQMMQQLGIINEAQAEAMQNQINVNTALMQSNAQMQEMLQSVNAVLAGQQQAVQNNQQRKRAQRSGGAN